MTWVTEGIAIEKHRQGAKQQRGSRWGTRTGHIMLEKKQIMKGSEAGELEWDAGCLCKLFMLSTHSHSAADSQDKGKR